MGENIPTDPYIGIGMFSLIVIVVHSGKNIDESIRGIGWFCDVSS